MPTTIAPASQPQVDLIKRLLPQLQAKLAKAGDHPVVATVTAKVTAVQADIVTVLQGGVIDKSQAHRVIDTLLNADKALNVVTNAAEVNAHPGILRPTKVISNRFAKKCSVCGTMVDAADGFAALQGPVWSTFCKVCADETAEARQARIEAEQAARNAEQAAARAQADKDAADRAAVLALCEVVIDQAKATTLADPKVRVAIDSPRDDQDLDFFVVSRKGVDRFLGGQGVVPINLTQQGDAVTRILAVNVPDAMQLFGQKLEHCARCGRPLTVQTSRDNGLGPDCYAEVVGV